MEPNGNFVAFVISLSPGVIGWTIAFSSSTLFVSNHTFTFVLTDLRHPSHYTQHTHIQRQRQTSLTDGIHPHSRRAQAQGKRILQGKGIRGRHSGVLKGYCKETETGTGALKTWTCTLKENTIGINSNQIIIHSTNEQVKDPRVAVYYCNRANCCLKVYCDNAAERLIMDNKHSKRKDSSHRLVLFTRNNDL